LHLIVIINIIVNEFHCVRCTEPSACPREVTAVAIGSQTLQVSWKVRKWLVILMN